MVGLGVRLNEVASLRRVDPKGEPDLIAAAKICELAGADQITVSLGDARGPLADHDVRLLGEVLRGGLGIEMPPTDDAMAVVGCLPCRSVCLVPEDPGHTTSGGGLDVVKHQTRLSDVADGLRELGVKVCLLVDAVPAQVDAAVAVQADRVRLNTRPYAMADEREVGAEIEAFVTAAARALREGLVFDAAGGLTARNLAPVAAIPGLNMVHVGHGLVARALFVGLEAAVGELLDALTTHAA